LSSVLAQTSDDLELPATLAKEPASRRIRAAIEYMVRSSSLTLASGPGLSRLRVGGRSVSVPLEYWQAARLASALKLRSLDLLHLAYAHLINRLEFNIKTFVTGDEDIISRADAVQKSIEIAVKRPADAV
jgi:predicted nucleic acid-binding protein